MAAGTRGTRGQGPLAGMPGFHSAFIMMLGGCPQVPLQKTEPGALGSRQRTSGYKPHSGPVLEGGDNQGTLPPTWSGIPLFGTPKGRRGLAWLLCG